MTDAELLDQLRKIIREEVEAEAKHTHTDISLLKMEVKGLRVTLEDRMKDLEVSNGRLESGQQELTRKAEALELNVEALREESKQAHHEIMLTLADSNEVNGKQIQVLKNKVEQLEEDVKFLPH